MPAVDTPSMNEHLRQISVAAAPNPHAALICDGAVWLSNSKVVPFNIMLVTPRLPSPSLNMMENILEFPRGYRLRARIWETCDDITHACAGVRKRLITRQNRMTTIPTRKWTVV